MNLLSIDNEMLFALLSGKLSSAINRKLYRSFRKINIDITPEQWTVLYYLWSKDGVTQQELCNVTFKDKPSMTQPIVATTMKAALNGLNEEEIETARILLNKVFNNVKISLGD